MTPIQCFIHWLCAHYKMFLWLWLWSSYLFARWHLFRHVGYLKHQQQVDLLTLKVVSESRWTWATPVPILVFLGLSVLNLGPMYVTDRCQTKASLNASTLWGRRHNKYRSSSPRRFFGRPSRDPAYEEISQLNKTQK